MWQLVSVAGGEPYRFLVGVDYVVGRKNCAVLIQDDQSISRAHATFTVCHPQCNLSRDTAVPALTVKDTSKYGTFVNGEKVQNDSSVILKSGDQVTCGVFHSKFRVEYEPLVACSSCLDVPAKSDLNRAVLQIGGHVVNNWTEECTILVMNSVKVTIKTICALICMRPIVKPNYFNELIKAIQMNQPLPKLESFYPPVDEPSISPEQFDMSGRQERRNIFRGKTFLFLNAKQHKKLSPAVSLGGGEAKLFPEGSRELSLLDSPGTCVIDAGYATSQLSISASTKGWIDSTVAMLESKGLRTIPEAEIGLSVIFMSTETYCNAQSHPAAAVSRETISGPTLSQSMAVDETIMAAPTFNTTAYVADTEPPEQPDTCMQISGVQEVKETPRIGRRGHLNIQDISTVKQSLSPASLAQIETSSFRKENRTGDGQKSQHLLPPSASTVSKTKDKASQQQTNLMKNYFQVTAKKREREYDDEKEMSAPKLAKSLNFSEDSLHITAPSWGKNMQDKDVAANGKSGSLSAEMSEQCEHGNGKGYDGDTVAKARTSEIAPPKKRKEIDDLPTDAEACEMRRVSSYNFDMGDKSLDDTTSIQKKRRLESVDNNVKGEDITIVADECGSDSMHSFKRESEMKTDLSESLRRPNHNDVKLEEDPDSLPSRLLLTEFKSLVVSNLRWKSNLKERKDNGKTVNYKKFRKVLYPGAGGFPNIIGGSDLIAHHTKKNSELEVWLREEMEGQTQQAREESLADDLFRYNPKSAKRRR